MYKNNLKFQNSSILLSIIFIFYTMGIILKKIFLFQDGLLDIGILTLLLFFLLLKPKKMIKGIKQLFKKKLFLLFLLLTLYYISLSFISHNTFKLIFLEYLSVFKWLIYFFIGYIFAHSYNSNFEAFPKKNDLLLFSLFLLIYSILFYNWSGIGGINTLFGFYHNSYSSIFSLRSVFALFGFIVFIYGINSFNTKRKSSLFLIFSSLVFLFMSGNRKMLIAYFLVLLFMKFKSKYKKILKFLRILLSLFIILLITQLSIFQKSKEEYSSNKQPRIFTYIKSFEIASDYFPFGSGPATFASKGSMVNYSPIYKKYNMDKKWGFGKNDKVHFYNDTYWAQIIGQYGVIGLILVLMIYLEIANQFKYSNSKINYKVVLLILLFLSLVTPALQRIEISLFIFFSLGIRLKVIQDKRKLNEERQ